jgi:hypothetical protein
MLAENILVAAEICASSNCLSKKSFIKSLFKFIKVPEG